MPWRVDDERKKRKREVATQLAARVGSGEFETVAAAADTQEAKDLDISWDEIYNRTKARSPDAAAARKAGQAEREAAEQIAAASTEGGGSAGATC